jgi:hypothetical protein
MKLRRNQWLPDQFDRSTRKNTIGRHPGKVLLQALRHPHAVDGVTMMIGAELDRQNVVWLGARI